MSSVKFLILDCSVAKFKYVHDSVEQATNLETQSAVKIIAAICSGCNLNVSTPEKINERDMVNLIQRVLRFVNRKPSSDEYMSYLQSAFYILKMLIKKEAYNLIVELEDFFAPHFIPFRLTQQHNSAYQSITKTIYNVLSRAPETRLKNDLALVLQLSEMLTRVHHKLKMYNSLFAIGHNCVVVLITLKVSSEKILQYYESLMTAVDRLEDSTLYPCVMNVFSVTYTYLLQEKDSNLASECYDISMSQINRLFKDKEFLLLAEIVKMVNWLNSSCTSKKTPSQAHLSLKEHYRTYNLNPNLQSVCDFIASASAYSSQLKWSSKFEAHSLSYKFLNDVASIASQTPYQCKDCTTGMNLKDAIRLISLILNLGKIHVQEAPASIAYMNDLWRYSDRMIDLVLTLKNNKCPQWQKLWRLGILHMYTMGVDLYNKKDEACVLTLQKFIKSIVEVEGLELGVSRKYVVSALAMTADLYYQWEDYKKCLVVSALGVFFNDSPAGELSRWTRAKNMLRENIGESPELQELTVVSVFEKFEGDLRVYVSQGLRLGGERKAQLLIAELRCYQLRWKSKVPMMSAYKELTQVATAEACAAIFVEVWEEGDVQVHESLPKYLRQTIRLNQKSPLLPHLYFLLHKFAVNETMVQQSNEMEKTLNVTLSKPQELDPHDQCEITSAYEHLRLSRHISMMKNLNKSLDLLRNGNQDQDKCRLFKLLINIGHEFSLHCDRVKALESWHLALLISDSHFHKLQAANLILEVSDPRKPFLQQLIAEIESSDLDPSQELMVYHLSKAQSFFYIDFSTSYQSFLKALDLQPKLQCSHTLLARVFLLHHKFNTLPCHYNVKDHLEYSLVRIHHATDAVNSCYRNQAKLTSYDMRVFFEVYEELVKMYHDFRCPREVRCYAKDAITMAQKMVLPLRTLVFLYYLGYTDVDTCCLDAGRVKIGELAEMLEVKAPNVGLESLQSLKTLPTKPIKFDLAEVIEGIKEIVLDVPPMPDKQLTGSPSLREESFKVPAFLSHQDTCDCFYCTSLEYHQLVLKRTCLKALLYERERNRKLANDFYQGCFNIHSLLIAKQNSYRSKLKKRLPRDLLPNPSDLYAETYHVTLFEYCNFLLRNDLHPTAETLNSSLLKPFEDPAFRLKHIHLFNEALLQQLNIITLRVEAVKPKHQVTVTSEDVLVKTPPTQNTLVIISPEDVLPMDIFKPKPKLLTIDLLDSSEDEVTLAKVNVERTPAPVSSKKVKVYASTGKKVLSEVPAFKEPGSNVAPSSDKFNSRTKLLTERLKGSSKKDGSKRDENLKQRRVRQNLLSDLNQADEADGGSVRRSARNRR